jgi:hypothetical protein
MRLMMVVRMFERRLTEPVWQGGRSRFVPALRVARRRIGMSVACALKRRKDGRKMMRAVSR